MNLPNQEYLQDSSRRENIGTLDYRTLKSKISQAADEVGIKSWC